MKSIFYYIPFLFVLMFQLGISQTSFHENKLLAETSVIDSPQQLSLFTKWQREEILTLRLDADFTALIANKNLDKYQDATLTVHHKEASAYETPVKIKARGKYRRRVCDFPPLKLKFKDEVVDGIAIGKYKTYKLVTHCKNEVATKEAVLREYLAYQMYAALSEQSFRTQLVEIIYVDEGKTQPRLKRYGFLIEDTDELEDRLAADKCDCAFTPTGDLEQTAAAKLALFQFMIGNNDWSNIAARNLKVLKRLDGSGSIPVPYDFDFSALVNASYAFPNPDYAFQDIRDRVLLIEGIDTEALDGAAEFFKAKKSTILATIQNQENLSKAVKRELTDYIESFYTFLEQNPGWQHQMIVPFTKVP